MSAACARPPGASDAAAWALYVAPGLGVAAGLEEVLEADAVEGGDEEAGRLLGLLKTLDQGVPARGRLAEAESQR